MMTINVRLFASYAEAIGKKSFEIQVPEGSTAADVISVVADFPGGLRLPSNPMVAVNLVYAKPDTLLSSGDEVALIPPVAGG